MEKELKIEIPEGYEIDRENSTLERIVFKKKQPKLPESWEEFCSLNPIQSGECFITNSSRIDFSLSGGMRLPFRDMNVLKDSDSARQHLALMQLHRLRDCYRQGWVPKMGNFGYAIKVDYLDVAEVCSLPRFLSFPSKELAAKFLSNFGDLILTAKDLLR